MEARTRRTPPQRPLKDDFRHAPAVRHCRTLAQAPGPAGPADSPPLGDGFAVSDDPQGARPGLQPVKRSLDVGRRPLARPAFTDPLNLARGLQRMKPPERLLVVESRGLGDLPDRMRLPRQLAKRPPQSILAWRGPQLGG